MNEAAWLALLCTEAPAPPLQEWLASLPAAVSGLLLAAPSLEPHLRAGHYPELRLVASLDGSAAPLALLQAALLASPLPCLLAVEASALPPPALLQRLLADPRGGHVLVCEGPGELWLPGRFGRGCLNSLARARREGLRELGPWLRGLRAPRLTGAASGPR